jgi:hypothetical protein
MHKREIAALLVTVAFYWPGGRSTSFVPMLTASPAPVRTQLAQERSAPGGYTIQGPSGGSGAGHVMVGARPMRSGKDVGEPCSLIGAGGQTPNGTCTAMGNQPGCVAQGNPGDCGAEQPQPRSEGAR